MDSRKRRTERAVARTTPEEKARIEALALREGQTLSEYVRQRALIDSGGSDEPEQEDGSSDRQKLMGALGVIVDFALRPCPCSRRSRKISP